jgi:hypothetical protein
MKDIESLVPEQEVGLQKDIVASVNCRSKFAARDLFHLARLRLFNVNAWGEISKGISSEFLLHDNNGEPVQRSAIKGDYFRIDLPGPGNVTGGGYDWVQVASIEDHQESDTEWALIQVHPACNPLNNIPDTAHFLEKRASSTFLVRREGSLVRAEIYGRNEVANMKSDSTLDKIRNAVIAVGAWTGLSDIQWHNLAAGLVHPEDDHSAT